jgi:hypothetical protein
MADIDERGAAQALEDWQRWSSAGRGRVPPSWAAELRRDPQLRRARVVVDVVFGREHRVLCAAQAMVCLTRSGEERTVLAWLMESEPELSDELQPGSAEPAGRSISVVLPGEAVRPVRLRARKRPFVAYGEVSLLFDGCLWEDRLVYLRGPCTGRILHGAEDEPVRFTISDPRIGGASIPAWILDEDRWSELAAITTSIGERVPIIIGAGRVPCLRVRTSSDGGNDDFLVGYGTLSVDSGNVLVNGVENATFTVHSATDALELPVTLLRWASGVSADFDSVYARAYEADADTTGLFAAIRRILRDFGRIDPSRISERLFSEAEARSANIGIAAGSRSSPMIVINQPSGALEYVTGTLCGEYPFVSMVWDGPGIGPVVVDHRSQPTALLVAGEYPLHGRVEGGSYEWLPTDDLVTRVVIRYNYQPALDAYGGIEYRSDRNSDLCSEALRIRGEENEVRIDAVTIGDASTAAYVADWLVEHLSRPCCEVTLDVHAHAWLALRVGDPVRWTDEEVEMESEEALIIGRRWLDGRAEISLRIWPKTWGSLSGSSFAIGP